MDRQTLHQSLVDAWEAEDAAKAAYLLVKQDPARWFGPEWRAWCQATDARESAHRAYVASYA